MLIRLKKIMELLFLFLRLFISRSNPEPSAGAPFCCTQRNYDMKKLYNFLSSFVNGNNFSTYFFSHFEGIKIVAQ